MTPTPLWTQVVGSHIWGHDTPDSDLDAITVYADDPNEILSGIGLDLCMPCHDRQAMGRQTTLTQGRLR